MKRLDQIKRSLKSYTNRVALNKERLLNENASNQVLNRAKEAVPKYEKKIQALNAEMEKYLAGRKKVKRNFKPKEEKPAIARAREEMPNESKEWLKPLSKNNLQDKQSIKPRYF